MQQEAHRGAEKVLLVRNRSRINLIGYYIIFILGIVLGVYSLTKESDKAIILKTFAYVYFLIAIISLITGEVKVRYSRLTITDRKLLLKEGILKKHETAIRYSSITEVVSKQSFIERLFNFGDLTIRTSGAKKEYEIIIRKISNPAKTKELIEGFMIGSRPERI